MLDLVILRITVPDRVHVREVLSPEKNWMCSRTIATYKKKKKKVYDYRNGDFGIELN